MASLTGGLVGDMNEAFAVLPTVRPLHTFLLTAVAIAVQFLSLSLGCTTTKHNLQPLLWRLLDGARAGRQLFVDAVGQCALCFFLFSWHVHEKAILMALIPLT